MDNSLKQGLILKYLDKNFIIKDGMIQNHNGYQYWGKEILKKLPLIFSYDEEFCDVIFDFWCQKYGYNNWRNIVTFSTQKLNVTWNPEMAQEIAAFHHIDAEAELTAMLAEQIAQEINSQILRDLKDSIKKKTLTADDFLNLVKCVGYNNFTVYDPLTYKPRKIFMSMKKQDIEYERQNNPHWQDWIRAT